MVISVAGPALLNRENSLSAVNFFQAGTSLLLAAGGAPGSEMCWARISASPLGFLGNLSFRSSFSFLTQVEITSATLKTSRPFLPFPDSSIRRESTCNAGDPGSMPGSGRSTGEGVGYPLQYSWASLMAQLVKNPPAMWETWAQSLGWEDPLEKGTATHSSIMAWRIP